MPCKHCHKPKEKALTFQQGRCYATQGEPYICARIDDTRYALISLSTGNRWNNPGPLHDVNAGGRFVEVRRPY